MSSDIIKKLLVSKNNRHLIKEDGSPFFYLADTAWELFHRLTIEEAELYLENRRLKKFNVIQAVVLAEEDGLNVPNAYGHKPLFDNNPLTPNEAYFQHVDNIIKLAENKGLYIGLLPTWGDKIELLNHGKGPIIFNPENAFEYGKWIGRRYKNTSNIIWINGGDRKGGGDNFQIWDAFGKGIRNEDPDNHLMTFHPPGGDGGHSSSEWFHESEWLDFNICQSGHEARELRNYLIIERDYNLMPTKPCFDAEPRYEDHAVNWKPELGWYNDYDVRNAAYWAVFSGACGNTYGCQPIWQMYDEGRQKVSHVQRTWKEALDLPGSFQMQHLLDFVLEIDFTRFYPAQHLLQDYAPSDVRVMRSDDTIVAYFPFKLKANLKIPDWKSFDIVWFNPKDGSYKNGERYENLSELKIEPEIESQDIVLVIRRNK